MIPRKWYIGLSLVAMLCIATFSYASYKKSVSQHHQTHQLPPLLEADQLVMSIADVLLDPNSTASDILNKLKVSMETFPKYSIPRLIYADMQAYLSDTEDKGGMRKKRYEAILKEMKLRISWLKEREKYADMIPEEIAYLAPSFPFALVMDVKKQRLFLFAQTSPGELVMVRDYYASIGKKGYGKMVEGDQRTPLGTYLIKGYIPGRALDPTIYGPGGAFPLDYPNSEDRREKRTGSGIWIHGSPNSSYIRTPYSSNGCISLSNSDFADFKEFLMGHKLPIVVATSLNWMPADKWREESSKLKQIVFQWSKDWSSKNINKYMENYHSQFFSNGKNKAAWRVYKDTINSHKKKIRVSFDNLVMIKNPENNTLMSVFLQNYYSDNYSSSGYKKLFWMKEKKDDRWRIIIEENSRKFEGTGLAKLPLDAFETADIARTISANTKSSD